MRSALLVLLGLVALSLVLQGRATTAVSSAFGWSTPLACADGADGRPADHERGSNDCCILCGARALDPAFPFTPSLDVAFTPPRAQTAPMAPSARGTIRRPTGWASAWSSRAPPHFS
jgi:hypothetical protein